jgi:glycosyltransferase involved in cell wall biosynthesis
LRILFLNPAGHLGGAERSLLDLMASIGTHPELRSVRLGLVVGGDGPLVEEATRRGVQVYSLPLTKHLVAVGDSGLRSAGKRASFLRQSAFGRAALEIPPYALRLRAVIREFAPTVVHSNGIKMHLLAAAVRSRAPLVWHVRDFIGERPLARRAMRGLAGRADAAIAISNAVSVDARGFMGRTPVSVVYDAIDVDSFNPDGPIADLDRLAGLDAPPRGTLRIGLVATYARWKGHELFLDAARRVIDARLDIPVRFYVVGGPIYDTVASQYSEDELRGIVSRLGLDAHVGFVPFQRRIDAAFRALDVVVHASARPEPFGRTIVEAMATGKALVAPREGGAAELYQDGIDAIGVPARDPAALAAALQTLAEQPARRESLGKSARAAAVARFSLPRLAEQVFEVYRATSRSIDREIAGRKP